MSDHEEETTDQMFFWAVIRRHGNVSRGVVCSSKDRIMLSLGCDLSDIGEAGSIPECIKALMKGAGRVPPSCIDILEGTNPEVVSRRRARIMEETGGLVFETPSVRYRRMNGGGKHGEETMMKHMMKQKRMGGFSAGIAREGGRGGGEEEEEEKAGASSTQSLEMHIFPFDRELWPSFRFKIVRADTGIVLPFEEGTLTVPESLRPKTMRAKSRIGSAMVATALAAIKDDGGQSINCMRISCAATHEALESQALRWIQGRDLCSRVPEAEIVVDTRMALDEMGVRLLKPPPSLQQAV